MNYASCKVYPEVSIPNGVDTNGNPQFIYEDSKMYKDLHARFKNRPLVNYLYASYTASDLADKMDQANIPRNRQNQHNAEDILQFINFGDVEKDIISLSASERSAGFTDINGRRVDFTNAKEALEKADRFNNNHKGLVAYVVQHGDIYNVIVAEKNSRTHTYGDRVKENLKIWDIYKQALNKGGVDIENMPPDLNSRFNALNTKLGQLLRNLKNTDISNLYRKDALTLFALSPNIRAVQNVVNAFGSIEEAAQAIDNINHGIANYTVAQERLLKRAVEEAKKFQDTDIDALIAQVEQMSQILKNLSPEEAISIELHKLNKKYHIGINEIHRTAKEIRTLSEAAQDAIITLQRQIRQIENERGNNTEGKRLLGILNTLMRELNAKKYCSGILKFLNDATTQISEIDNMLLNIPQTGTELEKAFGTAKILQNVKTIKIKYYDLISAISNENLIIDETISQSDIDSLRQSAKHLKEFFDKKDNVINDLTESTMITLMTEIVGNKTPDGQSIINAIRMAATDSSKLDFLYSIGRASNPIIAAMGTIIRNSQDNRDEIINSISLRVRRITDKLYKSGKDSSFIFEDEEHIASDIDWKLYEAARKMKIQSLYKQGLSKFDVKQAIETWEDLNTEDRIVDTSNGRTERVPNHKYRKTYNFQENWTPEQIEYYNEIMQIKGEIGSMLPAYAQHQYLPPQLRRDFLDALGESKNLHDVSRAFKNKMENLFTIREDDPNYNMNGIIDGDEFNITQGDFDNTPLRQIPIFFVNKVQQGELLRDFSAGITSLAGTAINYQAMNEVIDVVEFIGDFVDNQHAKTDINRAEIAQNKDVAVVKELIKKGKNTNTSSLIQGFVSHYIYGQKRSDFEHRHKKLSKLFSNVIAYTSFKGLATNIKGAVANYLMGELQMLIEAGAGEFYGVKDYLWSHTKLFGSAGVGGDIMELLTNNINHKSVLIRELFDPLQENFSDKSHKRYYKSMFRQLISKDCSFIGYTSGEYLIHYVNMYSVLHNQKVLLNGKKISLYDAFEITNIQDGNSEIRLKAGVTDLNGDTITNDYIDNIRRKIRYVNQSTHGSMNEEDKGLIHQKLWGRAIMNFRQWMVEHYSRRFRKRHFDATLGENREGYWLTFKDAIINEDNVEVWKKDSKLKALGLFMKDFCTFMFRAQSQWHNLNDMQKSNIKRVRAEMIMYFALLGLSFVLGEPDEHKKKFWRRWWIYQTRRMIVDTEASMPIPPALSSAITVAQSPMPAVNTMSSLLYVLYGLTNGDIVDTIKSGDHKGENRYLRNVIKYDLPFFKDWEQMQKMDEDDAIFKVFDHSPSNK